MSKLVEQAIGEVKQAVMEAVGRAIAAGELPEQPIPPFTVEIPADRSHGDFATNAAMVSARAFRMAPVKIGEAILRHLDLTGFYLESCEMAGAGFLNFTLSNRFYADILADIRALGEEYGRSDYGKGKRVDVEFVSANPTGPMHIGNARGGALGDCLSNVLDAAGFAVTREFYVNDAGNQVNKFGQSLEARYLQHFLGEENFPFPEDGYHGADIIERVEQFIEVYGDQYVRSSEEERREALVSFALPKNVQGLKEDLMRYRIAYDVWFHESTLHQGGQMQQVIDLLRQKGYTYEKEEALWFKATHFGADKDFVLVRSNGVPTYVVPDIAYHYNKLVTRGFDKAIDVLGADHHGYVPRLKAALQALGVDPSRLDVVIMQMVRLVQGGEVIKASKRSGKAITLVTLLDEVPIDAARFFFNLREPNSHFDFDLDLAVEQSSQNPVYYVQYAHARICSILKNLEAQGAAVKEVPAKALECLTQPEEKELIRHLAAYTGEIVLSARDYDPARMTRYAMELATKFHKFYNACRVMGEEEELMQARLTLCLCTRTVLRNNLGLLKITAPEVM